MLNNAKHREAIEEQKWQGKLLTNRWQDEELDINCYSLLYKWTTAPTNIIVGLEELY